MEPTAALRNDSWKSTSDLLTNKAERPSTNSKVSSLGFPLNLPHWPSGPTTVASGLGMDMFTSSMCSPRFAQRPTPCCSRSSTTPASLPRPSAYEACTRSLSIHVVVLLPSISVCKPLAVCHTIFPLQGSNVIRLPLRSRPPIATATSCASPSAELSAELAVLNRPCTWRASLFTSQLSQKPSLSKSMASLSAKNEVRIPSKPTTANS
mmetsp:Transcript_16988/g.39621  ORF Transcript_16988/g.39621 Transcript_16988/m.39621 type:complete len:208 (-) Transcript_16988:346-969(-)